MDFKSIKDFLSGPFDACSRIVRKIVFHDFCIHHRIVTFFWWLFLQDAVKSNMEYLQESQPSLFPKSVQTQAVLSRHPITAPLEWTLLLGAALIKLNADLSTLSFLNYFPAYSADPLLLNREDYRGGGWVRGGGGQACDWSGVRW